MEDTTMVVVRDVFQAKYGRGDEVVELFKGFYERWPDAFPANTRLYTDLSGPFFTIVTETEVESIDAYEKILQEAFSDPEFGQWFAQMQPLVDSGSREFYTLQASYPVRR
jgi:hypothetical protein